MSRRTRLRRRLVVASVMICVGVLPVAIIALGFIRAFQNLVLRGNSTPAVVAAGGDLFLGVLAFGAVGLAGCILGVVTLVQFVRLRRGERDEFIT